MVDERAVVSLNGGDERGDEIRRIVVDLVARQGYDGVTTDGIVAAARASKSTIYRRWPSKAALVVDAVRENISILAEPADTGELRSDLIALLSTIAEGLERDGDLLVALLDGARRHDDVRKIVASQFRDPGRAVGRLPLSRAIARGEVSPECESLMIDEVAMPMLIHRVLWHEALDTRFIEFVVDRILLSLADPFRLTR